MADYSISMNDAVARELDRIPARDLPRVIDRIVSLAHNPKPPSTERITGYELYRIRPGDYRVIYSIHDRTLVIWAIKVGHRCEMCMRCDEFRV